MQKVTGDAAAFSAPDISVQKVTKRLNSPVVLVLLAVGRPEVWGLPVTGLPRHRAVLCKMLLISCWSRGVGQARAETQARGPCSWRLWAVVSLVPCQSCSSGVLHFTLIQWQFLKN